MRKGQRTKTRVLEQAANLFNTQGYAAASLSQIMEVTGLEKGGIYNHFSSKEEIALQAFDFAVEQIAQQFRQVLEGKDHALERLQAIVQVFREMAIKPVLRGGCPAMNAAIEADDAHPALRERARKVFTTWRTLVIGIIERGLARGELQRGLNPEQLASVMIASLEGAVMLSRLYRDPAHIERIAEFLSAHLETIRR